MQLRRLIMSNYVKVLGFQIKLELESNSEKEYIIKNKEYERQLEESWKVVKEKNPNIVIYPEMTYIDDNEKILRKLSKEKLIIAGSIYRDKRNTTIIFQDGEKIELPKKYASGAEPMIRYQEKITPREFFKQNLSSHTFEIEGKKVVVLNCMEYYHLAYFIAREYSDIFAIISPCSNNNPMVFKEDCMLPFSLSFVNPFSMFFPVFLVTFPPPLVNCPVFGSWFGFARSSGSAFAFSMPGRTAAPIVSSLFVFGV